MFSKQLVIEDSKVIFFFFGLDRMILNEISKEEAQKVISEKMTEISPNHFVRGQAWKKFEFPDQKLKGGEK